MIAVRLVESATSLGSSDSMLNSSHKLIPLRSPIPPRLCATRRVFFDHLTSAQHNMICWDHLIRWRNRLAFELRGIHVQLLISRIVYYLVCHHALQVTVFWHLLTLWKKQRPVCWLQRIIMREAFTLSRTIYPMCCSHQCSCFPNLLPHV